MLRTALKESALSEHMYQLRIVTFLHREKSAPYIFNINLVLQKAEHITVLR